MSFSNLSDDDFLNVDIDSLVQENEESAVTDTTQEVVQEADEQITESTQPTLENQEPKEDVFSAGSDEEILNASVPEKADTEVEEIVKDSQEDEKNPLEGNQEKEAPDYKTMYEKIMAPFKANGRMVELRSPEEAIQLMQMGANYTRRMQELASVRKQITMLENNGLLDEGKLSYLIDLDKKNPEAIKKLIKDANLDPLEIDVDEPVNYQAGKHQVTDEEMRFRTVLDGITSHPDGRETVAIINNTWDQASKDILWQSPDIMEAIHEQKSNGVYARIVSEIDRQKTLGSIPADVPFLHAYKAIGDRLGSQGAFNDVYGVQGQQSPANGYPNRSTTIVSQPQQQTPLATKVAVPKPAVTNSRQVASASASRSVSRKTADTFSGLATLSDDEFLKSFEGRI